MSTNRVRPGTPAIELLRALATTKARGAGAKPSGAAGSDQPSTAAHDPAVLRQRLKNALQAIDLDDEEKRRSARRPVLQEILLWEFGETFRQHSEFVTMLDSIEQALDADPDMPRRFAALLRDLQK